MDEQEAVAGDDDNAGAKKKSAKLNDSISFPPDNILTPFHELKSVLEASPCPNCLGKRKDENDNIIEADALLQWRHSVKVESHSWGALTDVVLTCDSCEHQRVVCPSYMKDKDATKSKCRPKRQIKQQYNQHDSKFKRYPINYQLVLLVQQLGCGLDGLNTIFAHLGMSPSRGGKDKWKVLQEEIGKAEHEVALEVFQENIDDAVAFHEAKTDNILAGFEGTVDEKEVKRVGLLRLKDGRVGISVGMDGAWQKRSIGFGSYNSLSGMNYCVELDTKKILNLVVYSKKCTYCCRWRLKYQAGGGIPVPEHRCSQNFDPLDSSKSMEADASNLHKEDIELKHGSGKVHIDTLCTDDDSTVRANTKHSLKELYDSQHGVGNWRKSDVGWPFTIRVDKTNGKETRVYAKDTGQLNLQCYPINNYITDVNHRVRVIGKGLFGLMSNNKTIPAGKLAKEECYRLKNISSLFLKDARNRQLPFEEFCRRAPCMYLHHFDDHSCCDVEWCKPLQSQRNDGVEPTELKDAYTGRFRDKEVDWVTFKAVEVIFSPYLTETALMQCFHGQDTNKNESLNRKCSATAPKDRYFSGTMSLSDRFHMVAIVDTYGYLIAVSRVLMKVGLQLELVSSVLEEYCRRLDKVHEVKSIYRNKPMVKRKRKALINAAIKAYQVSEKKAKTSGKDYGSGMAIGTLQRAEVTEPPATKSVSKHYDGSRTLADLAESTASSSANSTPEKTIRAAVAEEIESSDDDNRTGIL
jgi:hypothetical protein